ncbi:MAG: hypothetical protein C5B49_13860 [Bdellovibrio sp.]|nr:MAG: hypothetical protein C5B49_13860 [Bdellovibrio sp.]
MGKKLNGTFTPPTLDRIFIEKSCAEETEAREVVDRFRVFYPATLFEVVEREPWFERVPGPLSAGEFERSKKNLLIKKYPGQFFKRCPGASQKNTITCCNYYVLNLGQQCNFNCSYCYLQSYLNAPTLQVYANINRAASELRQAALAQPDLPYRVGTGETIDSLSLDPITLYSRKLIEVFSEFPRWSLEFKTKSDLVDQFLDCEHAGNVVVSWSINPQIVIDHEEFGTASLAARLRAAEKCRQRGFPVAFHMDPLIWFPGWESHYQDLVKNITRRFGPEDLSVISIGSLRFQPSQRHLMRERFGMKESWVTSAEMFPSEGGKFRYDASLRREMLRFVLQEFKSRSGKYKVFFCMETPETWLASYEKFPMKEENLRPFFRPLPSPEGPLGQNEDPP